MPNAMMRFMVHDANMRDLYEQINLRKIAILKRAYAGQTVSDLEAFFHRFERSAKHLSFSPVDFYRKAKITDEELRRPRAVEAVKEQLVLWAFMEVGLKWIKESRADHPHMVPPWLPKLQAHFPIMGNELRLFVTLDKSKLRYSRQEQA